MSVIQPEFQDSSKQPIFAPWLKSPCIFPGKARNVRKLTIETVTPEYDVTTHGNGIMVNIASTEGQYGGRFGIYLAKRAIPLLEHSIPAYIFFEYLHINNAPDLQKPNGVESFSAFLTTLGCIEFWAEHLQRKRNISHVYHLVRANENSQYLLKAQASLCIYSLIPPGMSGLDREENYPGGLYIAQYPKKLELTGLLSSEIINAIQKVTKELSRNF